MKDKDILLIDFLGLESTDKSFALSRLLNENEENDNLFLWYIILANEIAVNNCWYSRVWKILKNMKILKSIQFIGAAMATDHTSPAINFWYKRPTVLFNDIFSWVQKIKKNKKIWTVITNIEDILKKLTNLYEKFKIKSFKHWKSNKFKL